MTLRTRLRLLSLAILGLLVLAGAASAQTLRLPSVINDHMVLQAGQAAPVWGWAKPGQAITVRFGRQTKRARAQANGRWSVRLDPLATSAKPGTLTISGGETRVISDVLVGEVWLASGQSNMEMPLGDQGKQLPKLTYEKELARADLPTVRMFKVERTRTPQPADDVKGAWVVCTPASLDAIKFSAAAYFFGRKLNEELGSPVGLIEAAWGGTRIEPWTPAATFNANPSLTAFARAAEAEERPALQTSTMYNGMIAPIAPYAIKGALWYQGEANVAELEDAALYADKMTALVTGWRQDWGTEFSFYYVQIAPHLYHVARPDTVLSPEAEPRIWEAQTASMRLARTGMIVTTDLVDELADIHPRNKKDVGERLARWALAKDYGRKEIVVSGPMFRTIDVRGATAVLHFDHVGAGLTSRDGKPLNWFIVAGKDGRFYPAKAVIGGATVLVTSPYVAQPAVVRFAWDEAARANFANKDGLPAIPFRTDGPFTSSPAP